MFEFHGWATIRVPDPDRRLGWSPIGYGSQVDAIKKVRAAINEAHDEFSLFDLQKSSNGLTVMYAHGIRNHLLKSVIELFRWVAAELPESYGLLYILDDESEKHDNEFRVWRLAKGKFEEFDDPFLSPCVPTIESWAGD